jgi:hypothetical protein
MRFLERWRSTVCRSRRRSAGSSAVRSTSSLAGRALDTSHDPDSWEKAADVCGLYLNPAENAVVWSVDERTRSGQRSGSLAQLRHLLVRSDRRGARGARGDGPAFRRRRPQGTSHRQGPGSARRRTPGPAALPPTHASWLDQVDLFSSILEGSLLRRGLEPGRGRHPLFTVTLWASTAEREPLSCTAGTTMLDGEPARTRGVVGVEPRCGSPHTAFRHGSPQRLRRTSTYRSGQLVDQPGPAASGRSGTRRDGAVACAWRS